MPSLECLSKRAFFASNWLRRRSLKISGASPSELFFSGKRTSRCSNWAV